MGIMPMLPAADHNGNSFASLGSVAKREKMKAITTPWSAKHYILLFRAKGGLFSVVVRANWYKMVL